MIAASLGFSIMGSMVKWVAPRIPFMEAVFFRAIISVVCIAPLMVRNKHSFIGNKPFLLVIRGLSGFIALSLNFYATYKITLADASILNQTSTLFVAFFSLFLLKEKVPMQLIIYIVCSLVGATLIVKPAANLANIPGLMGLASGFFASIAYISIRKLHETDSFFTMVFHFSFISAVGSFLFMIKDFVSPTPLEWFALIILGLAGTAAQLLMTAAYKYAEASIVSPYLFFTVIFSALWGGFFWKELPDHWSLLGAVLIIACGVAIMRLQKQNRKTVVTVMEL